MSYFTGEYIITKVNSDDKLLQGYLSVYEDDIINHFPHFDEDVLESSYILLYYIDGVLAGLFVYEKKGYEVHIHVDYISEEFRNKKIGHLFLGDRINEFKKDGYKRLIALSQDSSYVNYLVDLGFKNSSKHKDWYQLDLV